MKRAVPDLTIEYLPTDALVPFDRNARTHSAKQVQQIADSISVFGFNNPVLIDHHARIIAGHGRVQAAKLIGLSAVPTIRLEHLTEQQRRAYIIADNRLAEKAGWDIFNALKGDAKSLVALFRLAMDLGQFEPELPPPPSLIFNFVDPNGCPQGLKTTDRASALSLADHDQKNGIN